LHTSTHVDKHTNDSDSSEGERWEDPDNRGVATVGGVDDCRGKRTTALKLLAYSGLASAVLVILLFTVYVPWALTWGATEEEASRTMAGDDIVRAPTFNATRAVTISGGPEEIWPWIIQIGYKRAGFYSWDQLDNDWISSADTILAEYQSLGVGDCIPLSEGVYAQVADLDPNRFLLLVVDADSDARGPWTWAWVLYPLDEERTRLVTRLRFRSDSGLTNLVLELFEIVMMRRHMLGIKRRVES
jgi:hypothetical protein